MQEVATINVPELLAQGWQFRETPPKLSFEMWKYFLTFFGELNKDYYIIEITQASDWVHAKLLISPQSVEFLKERLEIEKQTTE